MNGFLRRMIGLCLMRMILQWMLPEGDSARYAGLGMELALILCMLQGLYSLFTPWTP